jgi:monoamine oxidase
MARSDADVVVIGAGMAGTTAARDLTDAGLRAVVVESQDRIGGRIFTDHDFAGIPVEQGAEFIHTDHAETLPLAEAAGLELLFCDPAAGYVMQIAGVQGPELYNDPSLVDLGNILDDVAAFEGPDRSAAEFLEARNVTGAAWAMADQMLSIHPLGDLHEVGMQGLRDDRVVELERGIDHRVAAGYDELPKWLARDLDVRLGWRAAEVRWAAGGVTVVRDDGEEITARAAVCTLPIGVLKSNAVRFTPELPAAKWRGLNGLEMGAAMKILFRFDEPFWPDDLTMLAVDGPVRLYWTPLFGRPDAPAVLCAYVTGFRARALSVLSEEAAAQVCLGDLDRVFPGEKASARVQAFKRIDWLKNPDTRGAYSFVRLGGAGSRAALAAPDTGALFWAGDGTATETIAAVVHAAHVTGKRAAAEAVAHLS